MSRPPSAPGSGRRMRWLALILAGHLVLAGTFSVLNPLGEAPDEADHWAYVVYLATERALPVGPRVTQSKHPPLYHATAAAIAGMGGVSNDFLRANPDAELRPRPGWSPNFFIHTTLESFPWQKGVAGFHLARLLTVLLSTATIAATYALGCTLFPDRPLIALAGAGLLAGIPEFAFIGSAVSNDVPAAFFATVGVWGAARIYRHHGRIAPGWWTGPALGLGLLTKTSTLGVWPAVGLFILAGAMIACQTGTPAPSAWLWTGLRSWKRWLGTGLLVALPALAIAATWFLRNWRLYGDPLGMALAIQTIDVRAAPWTTADTWWLLRGWFLSFWGKFGGAGHIPMPDWIYGLLLVASIAGAAGVMQALLGRGSEEQRADRLAVSALLLTVGGVALVMWRYSLIALGTDQGRLLFPAVGPIVLLLVAGWFSLTPRRYRTEMTAAIVVVSFTLGLFALLGVLRPAFAPPPSTAADPTLNVNFGELRLMSADPADEPVLIWQIPDGTDVDYRTVLRVVAVDGTLVWEHRRSPGAGRWSTDHWPGEYLMRDAYSVQWPKWAGQGEYLVEVGVAPFGQDLILPQPSDGGHVYFPLGSIERE